MTATKTLTYGAVAPTNPNDGDGWLKPTAGNTVYEYRWNTTLNQWEMHSAGVPPGGTPGQILTKTTAADYDNQWTTPTSGTPADATTTSKGVVQLAGDLAGTAVSPQIATGVIVDTDIAAANKDGVAATPSLRTLGTGGQQAAAGNDTRIVNAIPNTQIGQPNGVAALDGFGHLPAASRDYYGATPPAYTPNNGDIWIFPADAINGILWRFRYNAASGSTYKWEFIGGASLFATIAADETMTGTAVWADLATDGPAITVPRAGDYLFIGTANAYHSAVAWLGFGIGAPAATPTVQTGTQTAFGGGFPIGNAVQLLATGLTASTVRKLRYQMQTAGTGHWLNRTLTCLPIRVS